VPLPLSPNPPIEDLRVRAYDIDDVVAWPSGGDHSVQFPPLILYGYFSHSRALPASWQPPLDLFWLNRYAALTMILWTGNHNPPARFNTSPTSLDRTTNLGAPLDHLTHWRAELEFRDLIVVNGAQLSTSVAGTFLAMDGFTQMGYTAPLNRNLSKRPLGGPKDKYKQGTGGLARLPAPEFYRWGVRLRIETYLRIDEWWAKLGSYFVWLRGVPFMRLVLTMEMHTNGRHRIEFNGSSIPTQLYQTDQHVDLHHMLTDVTDFHTVRRTLDAGRNRLAPLRDVPVVRHI
jgi:hypothetical protein